MPRVLLIDDDPDLRESLALGLEEHGISVDVAPDGADALAHLGASDARPDAILLDLGMPRMNGWQFRDLQKRHPALSQIPVLVLTGEKPLGIDAQGVLQKPFTIDRLVDAIRRLTRGAGAR